MEKQIVIDYLRHKGVLIGDCQEFVIKYTDGKEIPMVELVTELLKKQNKEYYILETIHDTQKREIDRLKRHIRVLISTPEDKYEEESKENIKKYWEEQEKIRWSREEDQPRKPKKNPSVLRGIRRNDRTYQISRTDNGKLVCHFEFQWVEPDGGWQTHITTDIEEANTIMQLLTGETCLSDLEP